MKRKWFHTKMAKSRWYPAESIKDVDNRDDQAFLANTPAQAKYLLHNIEQAASNTDFYMNSEKIDIRCFN